MYLLYSTSVQQQKLRRSRREKNWELGGSAHLANSMPEAELSFAEEVPGH